MLVPAKQSGQNRHRKRLGPVPEDELAAVHHGGQRNRRTAGVALGQEKDLALFSARRIEMPNNLLKHQKGHHSR